jgi:tetratricopeptide (TPR) repeat protein
VELLLRIEAPVAPLLRADALNLLTMISWQLGDYTSAESAGMQAYALALAVGDLGRSGWFLEGVGIARYHLADMAGARATLEKALTVQRQREGYESAGTWLHLGLVAVAAGDLNAAESYYATVLDIANSEQDTFFQGRACMLLGELALTRGEHGRALELIQAGLRYSMQVQMVRPLTYALAGLAMACGCGAVAEAEAPLLAARLWGAVEALREEHGIHLPPMDRSGRERAISAAQAQADASAWAAAWAAGRALTLDEAITLALQLRPSSSGAV